MSARADPVPKVSRIRRIDAYIDPIVDHATERERTLAAYRAARDDS